MCHEARFDDDCSYPHHSDDRVPCFSPGSEGGLIQDDREDIGKPSRGDWDPYDLEESVEVGSVLPWLVGKAWGRQYGAGPGGAIGV